MLSSENPSDSATSSSGKPRLLEHVGRDVAPHLVLDLLEAGLLLVEQAPPQGLRRHRQHPGDVLERQRPLQIAAENAAHPLGDAGVVAVAYQQRARHRGEEAPQPLFVRHDRQIEQLRIEPDLGARLIEQHRRAIQRLEFRAERLLGKHVVHGDQRQPASDQPAHQAVGEQQDGAVDHPPALRLLDRVHDVDRCVVLALGEADDEIVDHQVIELTADPDRLAQIGAVDQQAAHHPEGARLDRAAAEQPQFVARHPRQRRDHPRELILRQPCPGLLEVVRIDAGPRQQPIDVEARFAHAAEDQADIPGVDCRARRCGAAGSALSFFHDRHVNGPGEPPPAQ